MDGKEIAFRTKHGKDENRCPKYEIEYEEKSL